MDQTYFVSITKLSQKHNKYVLFFADSEQNEQALKFYEHFGFKVISRSELDETGKSYPILRMQIQYKHCQH